VWGYLRFTAYFDYSQGYKNASQLVLSFDGVLNSFFAI
jgi:hypothetical protein